MIDPASMSAARRQTLPEMDDLEQLLNLGQPRSVQAPGQGTDKTQETPQ